MLILEYMIAGGNESYKWFKPQVTVTLSFQVEAITRRRYE